MDKTDSSWVSLSEHPDTPGQGAWRVAVRVERVGPDSLRLGYRLAGELGRLRIPPQSKEAGRADRLWAHTCFEAFIALGDTPRYVELNLSPSLEWAAYRFDSYREGMRPLPVEEPPRISLRRDAERLELEAEFRLRAADPEGSPASAGAAAGERRARLALSAVVEDQEGRLSYWALRHPPGRPDFHHPESFSLTLELPATF